MTAAYLECESNSMPVHDLRPTEQATWNFIQTLNQHELLRIFLRVRLQRFGRELADLVDVESGCLNIKFARYQVSYDEFGPEDIEAVANELLDHFGARNEINDELKDIDKNVPARNRARSKRLLEYFLGKIIAGCTLTPLGTSYRELWPQVSQELAQRFIATLKKVPNPPSWLHRNHLLFVSFFSTFQGKNPFEAFKDIASSKGKICGLKGSLVKLPDVIDVQTGRSDFPLIFPESPTSFSLLHSPSVPFVSVYENELRQSKSGKGFLNRYVQPKGTTAYLKQVEFPVFINLSIGIAERLIRCLEESTHPGTGNGQMKMPEVVQSLRDNNLSPAVLPTIESFFFDKTTNLRNRIAHGNVVELSTDLRRRILEFPDSDDPAPYSSEHILNSCFFYLSEIDQCIFNFNTNAHSCDLWMQDFNLQKKWARVVQLSNMYIPCVDARNHAQFEDQPICEFINATCPFLFQPICWARTVQASNPFLSAVSFGSFFETLYRQMLELTGFKIINSPKVKNGRLESKYKMLDSKDDGIAKAKHLDAIACFAPVDERDTIKEIVELSIDWRDAIFHGAIGDQVFANPGHICDLMWDAIKILVAFGRFHMTQEAAHCKGRGSDRSCDENWRLAEAQLKGQILTANSWDVDVQKYVKDALVD